MTVELKQAAKHALEALDCLIYKKSYSGRFADALIGLRTAIHQAEAQQPATGEPVVVQHRKPIEGWKGETIGYKAWRDGKGLEGWPHRELYYHPAPGVPCSDATPHLHVGESAFESWYDSYLLSAPVHQGNKQRMRDAYAAGMGDPLVKAAVPSGPDGYVLVPIEPTVEMMRAWNSATGDADYLIFTEHGYDAMLTAAQTQKGQQ